MYRRGGIGLVEVVRKCNSLSCREGVYIYRTFFSSIETNCNSELHHLII